MRVREAIVMLVCRLVSFLVGCCKLVSPHLWRYVYMRALIRKLFPVNDYF